MIKADVLKKFNPKEVVVVIPGLTWGTSSTLFSFINSLKRDFNQEVITLFYFAWDSELNKPWTKKLVEGCKASNINLKLIEEKYNTKVTIDFYNSILSNLNIPRQDTIPAVLPRTFQTFYMLHRLNQAIEEYNKDCYIVKLRSLLHFNEINFKKQLDDFYEYELITRKFPLHIGIDYENYIISDDVSRYYTSEKIFCTSSFTFRKVFNDKFKLIKTISEILKFFAKKTGHGIDSLPNLCRFIYSPDYLNDGGQTFNEILLRVAPGIPVQTSSFYSFIDWIHYKSPSYDLNKNTTTLLYEPELDTNYKEFIVS